MIVTAALPGSGPWERLSRSNAVAAVIAASVSEDQPEYAGGERMYAVLFGEDHEGVSLDANGNVAVLLDREQAIAARETLDEIVAELGGDRDEVR